MKTLIRVITCVSVSYRQLIIADILEHINQNSAHLAITITDILKNDTYGPALIKSLSAELYEVCQTMYLKYSLFEIQENVDLYLSSIYSQYKRINISESKFLCLQITDDDLVTFIYDHAL